MQMAKTNIVRNWAQCTNGFMDTVENDRQMPIGENSLQELILNLHIYEVWEVDSSKKCPRDLQIAAFASTRSKSQLKLIFEAQNPPSVIHIALIVPRHRLRVFTSEAPDKIGTPGLHLSISYEAANAENAFFTIKGLVGNVIPRISDDTLCEAEEDAMARQARCSMNSDRASDLKS